MAVGKRQKAGGRRVALATARNKTRIRQGRRLGLQHPGNPPSGPRCRPQHPRALLIVRPPNFSHPALSEPSIPCRVIARSCTIGAGKCADCQFHLACIRPHRRPTLAVSFNSLYGWLVSSRVCYASPCPFRWPERCAPLLPSINTR